MRGALKSLKRAARICGRVSFQGRVWPDGVVVVTPDGELPPSVSEAGKDFFVQQLVAQAAIEGFDERVLRRLSTAEQN